MRCAQGELPADSSPCEVPTSVASNTPINSFLCGIMPAGQTLEIIGKCRFPAVLNRGCATGEITLPPELLRDLADGSIFRTDGSRETKRTPVTTLNAADYPTDLVQRAFEFIRHHRAFRAAWVFTLPVAAATGLQSYQLVFLMSPSDKVLFHDLNLALHCSPPKGVAFDLGVVDETDKVQIMTLFAKAQPFYLAQDFKNPGAN